MAICGQRQESVDRAVAELAAETAGKVRGKVADVRSHEQVAELFQFVDAEFGALDVLVNNAGVGIFSATFANFRSMSGSIRWRRIYSARFIAAVKDCSGLELNAVGTSSI